MNRFLQKTKKYFLALPIIVLVLGVFLILTLSDKNQRLTESQILELRDKYPVCGINAPPLMEMAPDGAYQFERALERSEAFVYGEIIGDYKLYSKKVTTGYEELDQKREENGINSSYKYYEFTLSVINDTSGTYTEGDIITITDNTAFMDYNPTFVDGMKVVVPIYGRNDEKYPNRKAITAVGIYYVTEDGYAISAFNEETRSNYELSGMKVEEAMEKLASLKAKKAKNK